MSVMTKFMLFIIPTFLIAIIIFMAFAWLNGLLIFEPDTPGKVIFTDETACRNNYSSLGYCEWEIKEYKINNSTKPGSAPIYLYLRSRNIHGGNRDAFVNNYLIFLHPEPLSMVSDTIYINTDGEPYTVLARPMTQLQSILDMLRVEEPVYLRVNKMNRYSKFYTSNWEPVGENE